MRLADIFSALRNSFAVVWWHATGAKSVITKTPDGSIIGLDGKILFFSIERFVQDICLGDCCFICGMHPGHTDFNDEHVLPRWILKRFDLFKKKITLPNLSDRTYGAYKIPCCKSCNSLMGKVVEEPISELVRNGMDAIGNYLGKQGTRLFIIWMALIFIKTHLKDKQIRQYSDARKGHQPIADSYQWEELHHVHCLARAFYTGAEMDPTLLASFCVLPVQVINGIESFDYGDLYDARAIMLRVDEICFLSVLNDSNAALSTYYPELRKITGTLTPIQIREIFAHFAYINLKLAIRPKFITAVDRRTGIPAFVVKRPETISIEAGDRKEFGAILSHCVDPILIKTANDNREEIRKRVADGELTFLFNQDGSFRRDSMVNV